MAVSGMIQALIAAFALSVSHGPSPNQNGARLTGDDSGILVNAASAAVVLSTRGYGSAVFRDGLRLVLVLFLVFSALWAQMEFLTTVIDSGATTTCQIFVIFTALFDQLARVSIEAVLLWFVQKPGRPAFERILAQALLFARLALGVVFVGETRPDFNPTCVPRSNLLPLAIVVIGLDGAILVALAIMTLSSGSGKEDTAHRSDAGRRKTALLILAGLAVWQGVRTRPFFVHAHT